MPKDSSTEGEAQAEQPVGQGGPAKTPMLEWLAALIGVIVVATTIAYLLFDAASRGDTPPDIMVRVDEVVPLAEQYLVKFEIYNQGGDAAASLNLEGVLLENGELVETSSATVAYAPADSVRTGGMFFTRNPNEFEIELRATGYEDP
jgi:uncharacterized protein (TIGR02588 family)